MSNESRGDSAMQGKHFIVKQKESEYELEEQKARQPKGPHIH